MAATIDESAVRDALRQVQDPEAGMNVVDLGLIYAIEIGAGTVKVDLTMTTAACPMTELIADQVHDAVAAAAPPGIDVAVRLVWDPPWTPERMSDLAREQFGWSR